METHLLRNIRNIYIFSLVFDLTTEYLHLHYLISYKIKLEKELFKIVKARHSSCPSCMRGMFGDDESANIDSPVIKTNFY